MPQKRLLALVDDNTELIECVFEGDEFSGHNFGDYTQVFLLRNVPDYLARWLLSFDGKDEASRMKAWNYIREAGIRIQNT